VTLINKLYVSIVIVVVVVIIIIIINININIIIIITAVATSIAFNTAVIILLNVIIFNAFIIAITVAQRKRPSLVQMMGLQRQRMSARTKMGAKWLQKVRKGQVAPKG
jgi:hypothetical protein